MLIKKFSLKGGRSFERGGLSRGGAFSIKYDNFKMPNVNVGHTYSCCKHYQAKNKSFLSVGRQFSCMLKTNFHR